MINQEQYDKSHEREFSEARAKSIGKGLLIKIQTQKLNEQDKAKVQGIKIALDDLYNHQETLQSRLDMVYKEIDDLKSQKEVAMIFAQDTFDKVELQEYQSLVSEFSSTIETKEKYASGLETQITGLQASIDSYIIQIREMLERKNSRLERE